MKDDILEETLGSYARQVQPSCPADLAAGVWREIEHRRRKPAWWRFFAMVDGHELFAEPRLAAVAFGFAVMIGSVSATALYQVENRKDLARQSIHFEVFSPDAPAQLHTLFTRPIATELLP